MTTIFFYVLLFQIKDWDKICEEEGKMTSPIILNPAKRNVMVVKNEMRLLKQKRNVLQI